MWVNNMHIDFAWLCQAARSLADKRGRPVDSYHKQNVRLAKKVNIGSRVLYISFDII